LPDCERIDGCAFFNDTIRDMPSTSALLKRIYCMQDKSGCARHMVLSRLGGDAVPPNLYPNDAARALEILSTGGHVRDPM
jgi:hypothetical protein